MYLECSPQLPKFLVFCASQSGFLPGMQRRVSAQIHLSYSYTCTFLEYCLDCNAGWQKYNGTSSEKGTIGEFCADWAQVFAKKIMWLFFFFAFKVKLAAVRNKSQHEICKWEELDRKS